MSYICTSIIQEKSTTNSLGMAEGTQHSQVYALNPPFLFTSQCDVPFLSLNFPKISSGSTTL
jgi:hypothetical protein